MVRWSVMIIGYDDCDVNSSVTYQVRRKSVMGSSIQNAPATLYFIRDGDLRGAKDCYCAIISDVTGDGVTTATLINVTIGSSVALKR